MLGLRLNLSFFAWKKIFQCIPGFGQMRNIIRDEACIYRTASPWWLVLSYFWKNKTIVVVALKIYDYYICQTWLHPRKYGLMWKKALAYVWAKCIIHFNLNLLICVLLRVVNWTNHQCIHNIILVYVSVKLFYVFKLATMRGQWPVIPVRRSI